MELKIKCKESYYAALANMLRAVIPGLEIINDSKTEAEYLLQVNILLASERNMAVAKLYKSKQIILRHEKSFVVETENKRANVEKKELKLVIMELFNQYFGYNINPWGILTGVRPTKLANSLLKKGLNYDQLARKLNSDYGISKNKRDLLLDVVRRENKLLTNEKNKAKKLGIYIGIPFCPSKCTYCSFASYPIKKFNSYLTDFLAALHLEIEELGSIIKQLNLEINTIYLGGGTPTVLDEKQLSNLLTKLKQYFTLKQEFTVEAGRVDTITEAKLKLLKQFNANRICINPQTMNQATLEQLNRKHSAAQIKKTVALARKIGFETINMDLIIGLPDEGVSEIENTVNDVIKLAPENITLHALAYKRAASLEYKKELAKIKRLRKTFFLLRKRLANSGLKPYYMYRQKQTVGNLENIGYTKKGHESIYNIAMIEENQSIIAFGGGGITKLLDPKTQKFNRIINPRNPAQYIDGVKDKITEKKLELTSLFG